MVSIKFKVPFMLCADFESILKPVDEQYREKMNKIKTERKSKALYPEKIKTHVPLRLCVHNTFAYGDVPDILKIYRGKDCVETFIEHIEDGIKRLYATFPQQPMTELTGVLKKENTKQQKSDIFVSRSLIISRIER